MTMQSHRRSPVLASRQYHLRIRREISTAPCITRFFNTSPIDSSQTPRIDRNNAEGAAVMYSLQEFSDWKRRRVHTLFGSEMGCVSVFFVVVAQNRCHSYERGDTFPMDLSWHACGSNYIAVFIQRFHQCGCDSLYRAVNKVFWQVLTSPALRPRSSLPRHNSA